MRLVSTKEPIIGIRSTLTEDLTAWRRRIVSIFIFPFGVTALIDEVTHSGFLILYECHSESSHHNFKLHNELLKFKISYQYIREWPLPHSTIQYFQPKIPVEEVGFTTISGVLLCIWDLVSLRSVIVWLFDYPPLTMNDQSRDGATGIFDRVSATQYRIRRSWIYIAWSTNRHYRGAFYYMGDSRPRIHRELRILPMLMERARLIRPTAVCVGAGDIDGRQCPSSFNGSLNWFSN
ncbi:hypothetical protein BDZ94DRAFT_482492 [Collybia nuda]|uniref:Uncharacterized protein n=1 Tax=Collybia nuda TaxID=64659 RepID=A0A9P6C898_9AGAR|nr:hypothetical protein BDZ94DRAFT_482492 [Collybia nuda]